MSFPEMSDHVRQPHEANLPQERLVRQLLGLRLQPQPQLRRLLGRRPALLEQRRQSEQRTSWMAIHRQVHEPWMGKRNSRP